MEIIAECDITFLMKEMQGPPDMSSIQEKHAELTQLLEKFKRIYEFAPVPYHVLTPTGLITDINAKWLEILGYTKEQVVGKSILEFIAEEDREKEKGLLQAGMLNCTNDYERCFLAKDGHKIRFIANCLPCRDDGGNVLSINVIMVNVAGCRKAEMGQNGPGAETFDLDRINTIVYNARQAAHDMNNMMMPILGLSEVVQSNPTLLDNKSEIKEIMDDIAEASQKADKVLAGLRAFLRELDDIILANTA